jgi:hypothetical protein
VDHDDIVNLIKAKKRIGDLARTTRQRIQCPFCQSTGLDMQIYHDQNKFKCWVSHCGRFGSPIDWVMYEQNVTLNEAIKMLAAELGFDVSQKDRRAPVLSTAFRTFTKAFSKNSDVIDYWLSRGISSQTLFSHYVGYSSEQVLKEITRASDTEDRVSWQTLEDCKLADHGRATFWDHTVFPYRHWKTREIVQMQGRRVGVVGPTETRWKGLDTRSKLGNRSLNAMLWGEEELLTYWKRPGAAGKTYAFVLEGIPDALTLRQQDINALSIVGNQNLKIHTRSLKNLDMVYLVLDNDKSSQEALPWELYDMLLEMPKTQIITVTLPSPGIDSDGKPIKRDVNDFFLQGGTAHDFGKIVQASPDAARYLVDSWGKNESMYEPLLTLICERSQEERNLLLERLSSYGLFTMDQLEAFIRMMRMDTSVVKSRYRRSRK